MHRAPGRPRTEQPLETKTETAQHPADEAPGGGERWWWIAAVGLGALAALPFALHRHLPFQDLPLHQLAFAVWVDAGGPGRFSEHYAVNSWSLPYWLPSVLARPFVPLAGAEAASRLPIVLYAAALPLTGGLLARAAGRSGWWGLALVPFVVEFNLALGFVSYVFAGLLFQLVLAAAFAAEHPRFGRSAIRALPLLALCLGWTHPQMSAAAVVAVGFVALHDFGGPWRRRLRVCAGVLPALGPSLAALARGDLLGPPQGPYEPLVMAPVGHLLRRLDLFSIDVYPGPAEEGLLALVLLLLAAAWGRRGRLRVAARELRPLLLALGFLGAYLVTPWEWNGQAICQRMPYVALLCLPALAPPDAAPARWMQPLLVAAALAGVALHAGAIRAFDRETARDLDPLAAATPPDRRLAYLAPDGTSPLVRWEPYRHAGAWITLRRGGVYARNFDRLTTRHRESVPAHQTTRVPEFHLARGERLASAAPPGSLAFWDVFLVRWRPGEEPALPPDARRDPPSRELRRGPWHLVVLAPPAGR